jgi:surface-anchored protein
MSTRFQLKLLSLGILTTILLPLFAGGSAPTADPNPAAAPAPTTIYYLAGHGDLDIGVDDSNQLDLHVHVHAGGIVNGNALTEDTPFDPDQAIIVGTQDAKILRPAGATWNSTGVDANAPLWVLPQEAKANLPMFGLATEDIDPGIFVGDTVTLTLRHLKGPGDFSLWANDAFGQQQFLFSTHDKLLSTTLPVGLHAHNNWGFSRPGTYTLVFEVTGNLVVGGSTRALALYTFLISEKPIPLKPLVGDVNADGIVDDLDLAIVQGNLGQVVPVWPFVENQ